MYQFAAAKETTMAKFATYFQKFKKTVCALRANETKVTSRNTFIDNVFALENKKELKK